MECEFVVQASVRRVWWALRHEGGFVRCFPGVSVGVGGEPPAPGATDGRLRMQMGSTTITYRGSARVDDVEGIPMAFDLSLDGREARGEGKASALVRVRLAEQPTARGPETRCRVEIDVNASGRLAEIKADAVERTVHRLFDRFATSLAVELPVLAPEQIIEQATVPKPRQEPLLESTFAGSAVVADPVVAPAAESPAETEAEWDEAQEEERDEEQDTAAINGVVIEVAAAEVLTEQLHDDLPVAEDGTRSPGAPETLGAPEAGSGAADVLDLPGAVPLPLADELEAAADTGSGPEAHAEFAEGVGDPAIEAEATIVEDAPPAEEAAMIQAVKDDVVSGPAEASRVTEATPVAPEARKSAPASTPSSSSARVADRERERFLPVVRERRLPMVRPPVVSPLLSQVRRAVPAALAVLASAATTVLVIVRRRHR